MSKVSDKLRFKRIIGSAVPTARGEGLTLNLRIGYYLRDGHIAIDAPDAEENCLHSKDGYIAVGTLATILRALEKRVRKEITLA